jgi:hypothetical protein
MRDRPAAILINIKNGEFFVIAVFTRQQENARRLGGRSTRLAAD